MKVILRVSYNSRMLENSSDVDFFDELQFDIVRVISDVNVTQQLN